MPGNISGPSYTRAWEPYIRLDGEGFWERDYGGGGAG